MKSRMTIFVTAVALLNTVSTFGSIAQTQVSCRVMILSTAGETIIDLKNSHTILHAGEYTVETLSFAKSQIEARVRENKIFSLKFSPIDLPGIGQTVITDSDGTISGRGPGVSFYQTVLYSSKESESRVTSDPNLVRIFCGITQ